MSHLFIALLFAGGQHACGSRSREGSTCNGGRYSTLCSSFLWTLWGCTFFSAGHAAPTWQIMAMEWPCFVLNRLQTRFDTLPQAGADRNCRPSPNFCLQNLWSSESWPCDRISPFQLELVVAALIFHFWLSSRKCCISNSLRPPSHEKKKVSICGRQHTVFLPGRWLTLGIPPKQQLWESCMVIVGIFLYLFHPSWVWNWNSKMVRSIARLQCCNVSMCTRATTHGAVAPTPAGCLGWGRLHFLHFSITTSWNL